MTESAAESPATDSPRLTQAEWIVIALGAALLFTSIANSRPLQSANDRSRWATVYSLVHHGTYSIDVIDENPDWHTIDKVLYEGHFYSTKPPLFPTIVSGFYQIARAVAGLDLATHPVSTTRFLLLIVNWLPLTLAFIAMGRILRRYCEAPTVRLLTLATFCTGTLVTSYASALNNHTVAAYCLMFALGPMLRILNDESASRRDYALAGFWAALVPCNELPAALFGLASFILLVRKSVPLTARNFVPAAMIPLGAFFLTNWIVTDGIRPFYMFYGTELYLFEIDGIPSYWHNPRGLDQSLDSPLVYFLHCTIGHHGIFSLTPVLVLLFVTWPRRPGWNKSRLKPAIWLGLGLSVAVLGFYLTRTSNYNYGGNSYGLRWMIWLTPLWVLSLAPAFEWCLQKRRGFAVATALVGLSAFSSIGAARNPWEKSWLFEKMEQAGWIDYSNPPATFPFERSLRTWFADLPGDDQKGARVEFTAMDSVTHVAGSFPAVLALENLGRRQLDGRTVQDIKVTYKLEESLEQVQQITIDVTKFYEGAPISEFIVARQGEIWMTQIGTHSAVDEAETVTLLRGVPHPRPYRAGNHSPLQTRLRKRAFACQKAAVQVFGDTDDGRRVRYRSDLWLCDEVPFGVVQMEFAEFNLGSAQPLSRRRFVLSYCSSPSLGKGRTLPFQNTP